MHCQNCGSKIDETYNFCGDCGKKITESETTTPLKHSYKSTAVRPKNFSCPDIKSKSIIIRGGSVRAMRKWSIIIYSALAVINLYIVFIQAYKFNNVIDLSKSNFMYLTVLFISLIATDSKEKLNQRLPWFRSKWGWFLFIIAGPFLLVFIIPLFILLYFSIFG